MTSHYKPRRIDNVPPRERQKKKYDPYGDYVFNKPEEKPKENGTQPPLDRVQTKL